MKLLFSIYVIAFMQLTSSCQRAEPETYLIPADFVGEATIIFNQNGIPVKYKNAVGHDTIYLPKMGKPIKYERGRRLYEMPTDGILLTQFKDDYGFIDRQYFSIDANGKRTQLEVFKFEHFKKDSAGYVVSDKNVKGIFGDGTNSSYGNMNVKTQDFAVASKNQLDSLGAKEHLKDFNARIQAIIGY